MNKIIIALISLALIASPAFAWDFHIDAAAHDASVAIMGAGAGGSDTGFGYSVASTGGIIGGSGNLHSGGNGGDENGRTDISIGGSGASGDLIFATNDISSHGCCAGCPCPSGYVYEASAGSTITDGEGVHMSLSGGANTGAANQELKVKGEAGTVDTHMGSSLAVGETTLTHNMGSYGENVWYFAKGSHAFGSDNCGVSGFFVSVMGYRDSLCGSDGCPQ